MFNLPEDSYLGRLSGGQQRKPNKRVAFDFINFLNMPEIALANARFCKLRDAQYCSQSTGGR